MGNSNTTTTNNYKKWVKDINQLNLNEDSRKLTYYVLTKYPSEYIFYKTDSEIIKLSKGQITKKYNSKENLCCRENFFTNNERTIIFTVESLRNYFPITYKVAKQMYEEKLAYVSESNVINKQYYSGTVYDFTGRHTNTVNFDELKREYLVYCDAINLADILNDEFNGQQKILEEEFKKQQELLEEKKRLNKIIEENKIKRDLEEKQIISNKLKQRIDTLLLKENEGNNKEQSMCTIDKECDSKLNSEKETLLNRT
jgi:hypothetical protein